MCRDHPLIRTSAMQVVGRRSAGGRGRWLMRRPYRPTQTAPLLQLLSNARSEHGRGAWHSRVQNERGVGWFEVVPRGEREEAIRGPAPCGGCVGVGSVPGRSWTDRKKRAHGRRPLSEPRTNLNEGYPDDSADDQAAVRTGGAVARRCQCASPELRAAYLGGWDPCGPADLLERTCACRCPVACATQAVRPRP